MKINYIKNEFKKKKTIKITNSNIFKFKNKL